MGNVTNKPTPACTDVMRISVHFYSYFKDLADCTQTPVDLPAGATVQELLAQVFARFPKLEPMQKSALVAVGVEYQHRGHILQAGDEVSLFPPVQGG